MNGGWAYFDVSINAQFARLVFVNGLMSYGRLLETANRNGNDLHDLRKHNPLDGLPW